MKAWEYETIRDAMSQRGTLADWPELREALANNGLSLPGGVSMIAVREMCRLILAEQKVTDTHADSEEAIELQSRLLDRGIYVNRHEVAECYRNYCNDYLSVSWEYLNYWDGTDHIGPVDYIAARIGK
jgi:hypothetical protein